MPFSRKYPRFQFESFESRELALHPVVVPRTNHRQNATLFQYLEFHYANLSAFFYFSSRARKRLRTRQKVLRVKPKNYKMAYIESFSSSLVVRIILFSFLVLRRLYFRRNNCLHHILLVYARARVRLGGSLVSHPQGYVCWLHVFCRWLNFVENYVLKAFTNQSYRKCSMNSFTYSEEINRGVWIKYSLLPCEWWFLGSIRFCTSYSLAIMLPFLNYLYLSTSRKIYPYYMSRIGTNFLLVHIQNILLEDGSLSASFQFPITISRPGM